MDRMWRRTSGQMLTSNSVRRPQGRAETDRLISGLYESISDSLNKYQFENENIDFLNLTIGKLFLALNLTV